MAGFIGTFLVFRIQREAGYFRQPGPDGDDAKNLSHLTPSFLPLLLAAGCASIFGVGLPLWALGAGWNGQSGRGWIVGGLFASMLLVATYVAVEMVHYDIRPNKLEGDREEWRRAVPLLAIGALLAVTATGWAVWSLP